MPRVRDAPSSLVLRGLAPTSYARRGGAFVNCISATRRTEPRGWVLSVPLLDRVWTRSIGRRLRRGMLRRLGGRHDTRARFALFEGDKGKLLPPQFLSLYIVIAWKNSRRRSCVSLRILVVQKKPRAQLSAAVNTASFCGSYTAKLPRSWPPDTSSAAPPYHCK